MDTVAPNSPLATASVAPSEAPTAYADEALTKVDPNYKTALRISVGLTAIPFVIGAGVLETIAVEASEGRWPIPFGVVIGFVMFLALVILVRLPGRRWQARGYNMSADRLRVVRGILLVAVGFFVYSIVVTPGEITMVDDSRSAKVFGQFTTQIEERNPEEALGWIEARFVELVGPCGAS